MDDSIYFRIKKLAEAGVFKNPEIDRLGYGTFQRRQAVESSPSIQKARDLRSRVDAVLKESTHKGIKMVMEVIMMYIKGYMEESSRYKTVDIIRGWKSLGKYIREMVGSLSEEEDIVTFLRLVLFNVKFHYLYLESSLIIKQGRRNESKEGVLAYFLNEYNDLYNIFILSKMRKFHVLRPDDLSDMIKEKINSM
ncbi:hypothetical protein EROM_060830 [Encephalitozoon romaleae SJ-2008]|uniref:Uncharacterized protein n=1 Tax=Encephalitozoon romaleae (strain SJ-2008) TaxID=1178016 RepID=I6ZU53_ENCRO|nr:hypothetical protein EROM_060830 [Encephalitozoon romaleae SJ-2008]AFN83176.1 hypothetical protein EROM_060830 [Encephalitozoon romaleae SJ-2008]